MQIKSSPSNKNIRKEFKNLRKELLDLTLRNPLLNFKSRNKTLNIINQSPANVYKTLVLENKRMHFTPNKKESQDKISRAHAFISQTMDIFSNIEGDKSLKADLSPSELQKRLFYIDQQAKTMVQEQGYNILYIACGFVEWIDNKKPKQKNLAPLILIPVEIERKKAGNSFSISWTGEDLQHNISLEAKFREEGIEIPKFEPVSYIEGVDQYLISVKKAISRYRKWDVNTNVALGFFSFTKFVMYNDLNPESWSEDVDLTKNELIEAIFNPSKNVYDNTFKEEDIDTKLHYKTMYQVLDADSSQISVIENVKAGHNLVVEGPPGTGKSQTIVNLIAELIAEGKTVLFVSEKMAALEVVKSRLDSVGLGKFVLELHSHKTRRKKLLKELQKATNVRATRDLKLDQTLRKLENLRDQLDKYAEVIHEPLYNIGLSAFELYGMKESAEEYFTQSNKILPLVRMENPQDISLKNLDDMIISLENLSELYSTISKNNPWNFCNPKSLLPADLREIEFLIRDTLDSLNEFRFEINSINELYGIKSPNTLKEYEDSIQALKLLDTNNAKFIDSSILLNKEWYENPNKAYELIKLLEQYQKSSNLFNKFTDNILVTDLDALIYNIKKESSKKFRLFGSNPYKKELSKLYKYDVPSDKEVLKDLIAVNQNIKLRQAMATNERLATRYFGKMWNANANPSELKELTDWMDKFTYLLSNGTFSETTVNLLSKDLFKVDINVDMADYVQEGNKFYKSLKKLESKLNPRSKLIFKHESEDVPFDSWEIQLNKWKGQLSSLHLWSQYSNTKRACMNTSASIFVRTIEKRKITKDEIKSLVFGNFADSLLNIVFAENDTLASFIGELHENRIAEFKDLDRKIINLNRKRIFNKLNSQIPKIYGEAENPEAKVLAGEFTRKSGHLPVRNLLEKAGGTIKKIKPIFMMSPLSIAQYLDPTNPKLQFDVVIFDEASQVKPEDALGAFMRGKTAVVMGDTQQLPPTSFFDQMTDSEGGEEVATALDMESILHLCKLSFPVKMLKWHYRSRHESLINISNREFYDNELLVYPSPSHNDPELGLKFHYNPNTAYHRGNSSANPKEAKDVVKEIFKHFAKYGDKKSLGVGTFSVAQKNAILEELEIERKAHPEFEPLFSDKKPERFFVKNLETIQGDERDVILISVGYGYDTEGKMSLNFGPLNQDGGERRLNVLITRAREKCVVFTNFKAHDMHLTANPPFGVKSLRNFLEYAENIQLNNQMREEIESSPFEDAIYKFLVNNGYNVDKQVGCAGFRVDLAVIDDENPGRYILGIECDGRIYASSKVARDRDRLRDQVLNGLGWNIYHLWSTDWYRNRELAKNKLIETIEKTKFNTKTNEIKSKIHEFESMKINPVTTFVLGEDNEDENIQENNIGTDNNLDESVQENDIDVNNNLDESIHDKNVNINNNSDIKFSTANNSDSNVDIDGFIDIEELDDKNNVNISENNMDINKNLSDEYIETEEDLDSEYISDEISAYKTSDYAESKYNTNYNSNNEESLDNNEGEQVLNKKNKLQSYVDSISKISNEVNQKIKDTKNPPKINSKPKFKSSLDESLLKENYLKDLPELEDENKKAREEYDFGYDSDTILNNPKNNSDIDKTIINEDNHNNSNDYNNSNNFNHNHSNNVIKVEHTLEEKNGENQYSETINEVESHFNTNVIEIDQLDDEKEEVYYYDNETGKDGITYYDSAVGLDNALKKNSIVYPNKRKHSDKRSVVGSINDLRNEMKYINKACKVIENPQERENIYVIDRMDDSEEYIPHNESITPNHENSNYKNDEITYSNITNNYEDEFVDIDDLDFESYESDYIEPIKSDSINTYTNSINNTTEYETYDNYDYYNDYDDVIVPINQEQNKDIDEISLNSQKEVHDIDSDLNPLETALENMSTKEEINDSDEDELEKIILDADKEYRNVEKTRFEETNILKSKDTTRLTPKGKIEDYIFDYVKATNIGFTSSSEVYDNPDKLSEEIRKIINIESPIHEKDLILRIRESCNLSRAGAKFKQTIMDSVDLVEKSGHIVKIDEFLFTNEKEVKVRSRVKPNMDYISPVEIEAAVYLILSFNKSMKLDELTKKVAKSFGFKSTSKKTANKIHSVLDSMIVDSKIINNNGRIEFNE